ncbi:hypothetical protein [Erwinia phage phiEaP8]|uniref:Uncharacterized protein n=2 Tax=Caudoviricetes TaxID=2731619 RepID=A0A3G1QTP7_9CAUD|nr:hypothetical protein HYP64_gp62 [Erwinia phage phiEaP8]AWN06230.1 hypothetical protein [Erwinia phage phiEaP8]
MGDTFMSSVYRSNRKAEDDDIIRLNSVGLSLGTIAKLLNCHSTTITLRLKSLGIDPADTRRAFMEDIFKTLSEPNQEWLADQLGPHMTIKEYVRQLIIKAYHNRNQKENA